MCGSDNLRTKVRSFEHDLIDNAGLNLKSRLFVTIFKFNYYKLSHQLELKYKKDKVKVKQFHENYRIKRNYGAIKT